MLILPVKANYFAAVFTFSFRVTFYIKVNLGTHGESHHLKLLGGTIGSFEISQACAEVITCDRRTMHAG